MKKVVFLFSILIILIIALVSANLGKGASELVSPFVSKDSVLGLNQWFPGNLDRDFKDGPKITAESSLFVDTKSGQVLFSKDSNKRLPIASLVKVMTVLVSLELKSMDSEFIVSQRAADMEPDKMLLISGERLTLKELLDGIFLVSANDAAEVLAEGVTGNRDEFIHLMNDKAAQLGLKDTHYVNPTGLDEDDNNSYSTAYDLVVLTRYLIKHFPQVVDISSTEHIFLPPTSTHQDYDMYSGINLLTTYPGVVGFKTGYTPEAGLTLVTLARKNGQEIIGVLLGSASRRDEARALLEYSFSKLD